MEKNVQMKRKKRLQTFNTQDRKKLIMAVRDQQAIWDIACKKHSDSTYINLAWQKVGAKLNKEAEDCKRAWTSLRESYRYHCKVAKAKRSKTCISGGSDSPSCDDDFSIDWEFAEDMSFLPVVPPNRQTYRIDYAQPEERSSSVRQMSFPEVFIEEESSHALLEDSSQIIVEDSSHALLEDDTHTEVTNHIQMDEDAVDSDVELSTGSNYKYKRQRSSTPSPAFEPEKIYGLVSEIINQQSAMLSTAVAQQPLAHYEVYAFWDSILKDMPPAAIKETKFEVTALLHKIVKKYDN